MPGGTRVGDVMLSGAQLPNGQHETAEKLGCSPLPPGKQEEPRYFLVCLCSKRGKNSNQAEQGDAQTTAHINHVH